MEMIEVPRKEYEALKSEYEGLKGLVVALTNEITELKAKLKKNSKNSNKPPSSDGPKKRTVHNSRTASNKKPGGQLGHEGKTRELTSTPDTIVELKPQTTCECGGEVVVSGENFSVKQVTDVELPKIITVEYQAKEGICADCGKVHKAGFPEGIRGVASYGNNLQAIVTYLTVYQLMPLKRTTELIKDMYGIDISQAFIVSSNQEAYENLKDTEERTKEAIIESDVAHFDESGARVAGRNYWLHSAGTKEYTVYSIHPKRGKEAMDEMGILPCFRGTAIHDHWKSYYHYLCAHGECNQHHLRHLQYLYENMGCLWAGEMICLLLRIKKHVDLAKLFKEDGQDVNGLEQQDIEIYERMYRCILEDARKTIETAPTDSRRMINRMSKFEQETLLFMYDFSIPFTNNLAERDVRMPKVKQKISGGFRTKAGANAFARIRGFVSTVKKKRKCVMEGITAVFKGDPLNFLFPESL